MENVPTFLDAYELRARYFPALILAAPFLTAGYIAAAGKAGTFEGVLGRLGVSAAFIYVLSLYVRHAGREIQKTLWISWNGGPSTRFVRWRDSRLPKSQKASLHAAIDKAFGIKLLSATDEMRDLTHADGVIDQAFDLVRPYLRTHDSSGLVAKQNAEYGVLRNLLGVRTSFAIESGVCLAATSCLWVVYRHEQYLWAAIASCVYLLVGLVVGWKFLPQMTKLAAESYAANAWTTFLQISTDTGTKS